MNHLSESEYEALQQRLTNNDSVLVVPRSVARQFYLRVPHAEIERETGENVAVQKLVIFSGITIAPLLLLICFAVVAANFGFWAAAFIPLLGAFWAILTGLTVEDSEWQVVSATLVAVVLIFAFVPNDYTGPLALFTASVWVHRMTFLAARYYLTQLLQNSYHTFDQLTDHITEVQQ